MDYPYAFQNKGEPLAVDDLIVRNAQTGKRWAFAGRLLGDPVASVYRAMCGLFLHPQSALLDNTYDQKEPPWTDYRMTTAARTLRKALPVTERDGEAAGLMGWHQTLDPVNPFGLILLNTHGGPDTFHLADGFAQTADIPETGPAVVLMVHSFSASARPTRTPSPDDGWQTGFMPFLGRCTSPTCKRSARRRWPRRSSPRICRWSSPSANSLAKSTRNLGGWFTLATRCTEFGR